MDNQHQLQYRLERVRGKRAETLGVVNTMITASEVSTKGEISMARFRDTVKTRGQESTNV